MKVLLAIDGSSYSTAAVELVASRPWPPDSIVNVLMAVEPIVQPPDMWSGMVGFKTLELARKELTSQAEQLVKNTAERLRKTSLMVETEVSNGDPRSIILDQAEENGRQIWQSWAHMATRD